MTAQTKRALLVAAPILSLGLATGVSAHQIVRLATLKAQVRQVDRELKDLASRSKTDGASGAVATRPYVGQTMDEESSFLQHIRQCATANRVTIASWTSIRRDATQPCADVSSSSATPSADSTDPDLLAGLTAIDSDVNVVGDFESIRQFMKAISRSDRLLTIESAVWSRGQGGSTTLRVKVTRYVSSAVAANGPTDGATAGGEGHEG